jgi:hypothetical protein
LTNKATAKLRDSVAKEKFLTFEQAKAQTLVPHATFVCRFGGAGEPTFIDTAAVGTVGIQIGRIELDATSRVEKTARNPSWRKSQQTAAGVEGSVKNLGDTIFVYEAFV